MRSGGIEARTGLRMMPTSPRSPLSFRTAGFPQYGWKVGLSGGAFPSPDQLKPAPGMRRFPLGLRPSFAHHVVTTIVPLGVGSVTRQCAAWWIDRPPPQGPSLGSGLFCPGPSSLSRPHPPHSQAHRAFAARRLIRNALAVRDCLGDPRVVPSFRCTFLPGMPSSQTPGSSTPTCPEVLVPTSAFAAV